MKVATTIVKTKDGWKCLACGENIQEQRLALKQLLNLCGSGESRVICLTNGKQPAARKSIKIDGDIVKIYAEAQKAVAKDQAEKAKVLKKVEADADKAAAEIKKARKAVSDKVNKRA